MAFPTIQTADTTTGTTGNSTSWTITYPANIAAGDLLLLFIAIDGGNGRGTLTAWSSLGVGITNAASSMAFFKKVAVGGESGTFTYAPGSSESGAWRCFRITGWEGTIGTTVVNDVDSGAVTSTITVTGSPSANPNPPSLDPNNWATEDTLWFAACSIDTSRTISVYPYANNNTADGTALGSGGATLGLCTTTSAVSSLDPGTFTASASDDWCALTVGVRPVAAAIPPHPWRKPYSQFGAY
jgi:hypothetical protein